jgi:hypothetical protein
MNGAQMAREMAQQPSRLRDLVARTEEIAERVRALGPSSIEGRSIVARGSSITPRLTAAICWNQRPESRSASRRRACTRSTGSLWTTAASS